MEAWTAFTLGLFGSFHCIGMCGPIVLAMPASSSLGRMMVERLIYHLSRTVSYALLGLLFGVFGFGVALIGYQNQLAIGSGLILLYFVIFRSHWNAVEGWISNWQLMQAMRGWMGRVMRNTTLSGQVSLGFLNGFLPCGFVYLAILGSLNQPTIWSAGMFMIWFGLGTIPTMLAVNLLANPVRRLGLLQKPSLRMSLTILVAALFILRGMELGIPFVSPDIQSKPFIRENTELCD